MKKVLSIKYQVLRKKQKGQVIVVLLLIMLVALSVGLAVTQRSLTDVTTSSQTEQSSRSFSAAEAGIEKVLTGNLPTGTAFNLDNNSTAQVESSGLMPYEGYAQGVGIEYPPIGRETTAQFWFISPTNPALFYNSRSFYVYFGNDTTTERPAVEVKVVMERSGNFEVENFYLDSNPTRAGQTGFTGLSCGGSNFLNKGILGDNHNFFCRSLVTVACPNCKLILARVRILYAEENHKLALGPIDNSAVFPPQVRIYNSTGVSGQSQKQLQAFRVIDVVPPWLDFAVFSINEIRKSE